MEDEKIIEQFFARKESAITAVRDTYGSYCARIAGNILDSEEDVDEILSDTWLKVWDSIPPRRPDNFKLYIGRIARNLSFDRFRSKSREKRGGGEMQLALEELGDCIGCSESIDDALTITGLTASIHNLLQTLPPRHRCVFIRRYFFVEPIEQISVRYGIKKSNVLMILTRVRKKLKAHLIKEGFFYDK